LVLDSVEVTVGATIGVNHSTHQLHHLATKHVAMLLTNFIGTCKTSTH